MSAPAGLGCAGSLDGMTSKRGTAPVWIPLDVSAQDGRKVTLTGSAAVKLSEKITTPRALEIKDRNRRIIGRIRTIDNDHGRQEGIDVDHGQSLPAALLTRRKRRALSR